MRCHLLKLLVKFLTFSADEIVETPVSLSPPNWMLRCSGLAGLKWSLLRREEERRIGMENHLVGGGACQGAKEHQQWPCRRVSGWLLASIRLCASNLPGPFLPSAPAKGTLSTWSGILTEWPSGSTRQLGVVTSVASSHKCRPHHLSKLFCLASTTNWLTKQLN